MDPRVEGDPAKSAANEARHGLSFEQASQLLLGDRDHVEIYDEASSTDENRYIVLMLTERSDDVIRIISARQATPSEVELFHEHGER